MKQKRRLLIRSTILLIIVVALGYTFYQNFFTDQNGMVKVGEKAPDFVLKDLNDQTIRLSDYRGKGVFLNFWGTYCPPCEKEMPYMENQYERFKELGVEILAVNVNEPELTVSKFVERHKLSFPIPMDSSGTVMDAYGISPLPTTFLIDENGIVIQRLTGGMTEVYLII
ncbi:thiol-disulfide oxidoreductase ResA [Halalkalibacterium halodurans]|uniref:thiol-disulfide oxidoreductase ResA n=1 Tax=Halalkalibacterium halodurans TaxID=86665 RepID=UPI001068BD69|nr:thiol-disulfide oxidoreductase ResA [Halalkalibacterium halodurans]TES45428.1 thiol-disulfide oxidoreductase ResA [Halalkalibacterium halodurans]